MSSASPARTALLPRLVGLALLAVLGLILLQQTADKIDARLVQLGDAAWPGYAMELRQDPQPPACDLDKALATQATCVPEAAAAPAAAAPSATDDPFGTPDAADPFGTPEAADPFGTREAADPFGTPEAEDPFAGPATSAAPGVPCAAAHALVAQCTQAHAAYTQAQGRLSPAVRAFRALELRFRDLAQFAYGLHLLSIVLLLGGVQATWLDTHIALRPVASRRDRLASHGAQLGAHLLLAASAFFDWRVLAGLQMEAEHPEIPLLWAVGFGLLALLNLRRLLRSDPVDTPVGGWGAALLAIPLYAWMAALTGAWFLLVEHHSSGQAIYLHKFGQIPSVYLAVALYVWSGMLLERTTISARVFDLVRPWKLPVPMLAWVVVVAAALPTAYSGASGIFVIAAGAVIFEEMRRAGASPSQARLVTAMSGSLGVVLRPCLIVVLVASLNKEVTTDQLYDSGRLVFGLTAFIFLVVLRVVYRPTLRVAPVAQALPATLAAARHLVAPLLIGGVVLAVYALGLHAPLNERTAPFILPTLLGLVLLWERRATRSDPQAPSVLAQAFRATRATGEHTGALLFLMAATVGLGGVVERSEIMQQVPTTIGGPFLTMALLVVIMVLVGMTMDPMGAVILVSVTLAGIAYGNGIDPVHFWMMVLVAFELGYLTPPVALNQLLTRQVVGEAAEIHSPPGASFFTRFEHILVPMIVMGTSLLIVAFGPLLWNLLR